jgi:hypothetical protein
VNALKASGDEAMLSRRNFLNATVALAKYPNVSVKLSATPGLSREPNPFRT